MGTHTVNSEEGAGVAQVYNMTFQTKLYHFEIYSRGLCE